jgi:hypothetical protein
MVNTNAQVGKENNQVVGQTTRFGDQTLLSHASKAEQSQGQRNTIKVETAKDITVNEAPFWMIIFMIVGWILPSPNEIARLIRESKLWKKILA